MRAFLLFTLFVSRSLPAFESALIDRSTDFSWEEWKLKYGKSYSLDEEIERRAIWEWNLMRVLKHNAYYESGNKHYKLELNFYSDMEMRELPFRQALSYKTDGFCSQQQESSAVNLPKNVDWRKLGCVATVRNQDEISASSAFSAVGALEGHHCRKSGMLVPLSVQNVMDCCTNETAPNLLSVDQVFYCIYNMTGLDTAESYPQSPGPCRFDPNTIGATLKGCVDIASGSESELERAVASLGPVSVMVDAGHTSFQLYKSGIYFEPDCSSQKLDHYMLVVGYGEEDGQQYWIVKNSWGKFWGMDGYIRMAKNLSNNCGIATRPSYPVV